MGQVHQAGPNAVDLCREQGADDTVFYKWRSKFGNMEVPEAEKLKAHEA